MKCKYKIVLNVVLFLVIFALLLPSSVKAADSYTDARMFYETCENEKYHVEFTGLSIYYATKAKTAKSIKGLRYETVGWQITMSANGQSISVELKRGGSYLEEVNETQSTDGYSYNLYKIDYNTLCDLTSKNN